MNITYPQRLLLEIIQRGALSIAELEKISGLKRVLIDKIVKDFIIKRLVVQKEDGTLKFNNHIQLSHKQLLLDQDSLHVETSDMLNDCLDQRIYENDSKAFNCKKVSMSDRDYRLYQGLLYNLEAFIKELEEKPFNQKNNHIIYWGERKYEDVICNAFNI